MQSAEEVLPSWAEPAALIWHKDPRHGVPFDAQFVEASGWPMPSLKGGAHAVGGSMQEPNWRFRDTIPVERIDDSRHIVYLPLSPIELGFVIDTLFYAAIWFGVFFGFASAKRAIRRKRGRCPRCGYDLRGGVMSDQRLAISGEDKSATFKPQASGLKPAPGCPECGWNREESAV
jgi:hypothetical protein